MKTKSPCYQVSSGVNCAPYPLDNLRLELTPSSFLLLPYHHMEFAKFESAKASDLLTVQFLNREVKVAGRNLRDLALALQERSVEFIRPIPERYSGVTEDGGLVESIEVEAVKAE